MLGGWQRLRCWSLSVGWTTFLKMLILKCGMNYRWADNLRKWEWYIHIEWSRAQQEGAWFSFAMIPSRVSSEVNRYVTILWFQFKFSCSNTIVHLFVLKVQTRMCPDFTARMFTRQEAPRRWHVSHRKYEYVFFKVSSKKA